MKQLFGWTGLPTRPIKKWMVVKDLRCDVSLPECEDMVAAVDQYVNELLEYRHDIVDSWSPPTETLQRRYGDCEDFALLKRAILLNHGVRDEDILFLIVRDLISRCQHAILVVDGRVLDNFNSLTLPVDQVQDYVPITGCSADRGFIFGK